jgi:hypothetical protein
VHVTNGDGEIALEVEDAGGTLDIATRDDGGTRSRVTLPVRPAQRG